MLAEEARPPTSAGMSDSCVRPWPPDSHRANNVLPFLTHMHAPSHDLKKKKTLTGFICPHTPTHRDHLPKQRHIEFLHTDTRAPASPPPTAATINCSDCTTKNTIPSETYWYTTGARAGMKYEKREGDLFTFNLKKSGTFDQFCPSKLSLLRLKL